MIKMYAKIEHIKKTFDVIYTKKKKKKKRRRRRRKEQNRANKEKGRKEGNVLFNDALNTFYLRLYGVGHMVKDHSDSERGNPLV